MASKTPDAAMFPKRNELDPDNISYGLKAVLETQRQGVRNGKRPFAAVLIAPDRQTVLLRQFSLSHTTQHAESELCRSAALQFKPEFLWRCTMFSTWEPCAMCAGVLYWSNIGTLVYAASEKALQVVIGADNPENYTLDLPCRELFAKGQKEIRVIGPVTGGQNKGSPKLDWQSKVCEEAWTSFWQDQRGLTNRKWEEFSQGKIS